MNYFHNILFLSDGIGDDLEALQYTLNLAHRHEAALTLLIVAPPLPRSFTLYKSHYELFLKEQLAKTINAAKMGLPAKPKFTLHIDIEWDDTPSIKIIQRVLRQSYDLLVKAAEDTEHNPGFKALDMSLLRKCPCPLFLYRPLKQPNNIRIGVAIDPENEEHAAQDLTSNLLKLAHALSIHFKGSLHIISCWDFVLEKLVRHSAWLEMPQNEVDEISLQAENANFQALNQLITQAGINDNPNIYHLKGDPSALIPAIVDEKKIDILVMGTVARTGISGFIIGNTAENIVQKINCSLWALKPPGFISPIKAY